MDKRTLALIDSVHDLKAFPRLYFSERPLANKQYEITSLNQNIYANYDYGIKYDPREDLCFIFNLAYRRELNKKPKSINITSKDFDLKEALDNGCYYKKIQGSGKVEKIIIIYGTVLRDVLKDIDIYAQQNEYDGKDIRENSTDTLETRDRKNESITRLVRNHQFRVNVLTAYEFECAICRCNIPQVLQAAHIVPVKEGGSDNSENGICLCANHHLMLDNNILKIDFENLTLYDVEQSAQELPWYNHFENKFFSKVKERKLCRE